MRATMTPHRRTGDPVRPLVSSWRKNLRLCRTSLGYDQVQSDMPRLVEKRQRTKRPNNSTPIIFSGHQDLCVNGWADKGHRREARDQPCPLTGNRPWPRVGGWWKREQQDARSRQPHRDRGRPLEGQGIRARRRHATLCGPVRPRVSRVAVPVGVVPGSAASGLGAGVPWALIDGHWSGARGTVVVRTRYIDDLLSAALRHGVDQVVILGAGFDCRAYRIQGIERTRVFEVDHPLTQGKKQDVLRRRLGALPPHVAMLALDFNTHTLDTVLPGAGYRREAQTFFMCEGVTHYLSAGA